MLVSADPTGVLSALLPLPIHPSCACEGSPFRRPQPPRTRRVWRSSTGTPTATIVTSYSPIPDSSTALAASAAAAIPAGLGVDPTKAVQLVTGPDGQSYPVFTYIIMVQPSASYGYLKQVTVIVVNPQNTAAVIATQSSLFEPN